MISGVTIDLQQDSPELKQLLGIEEKGVFDYMNIVSATLHSSLPLVKQGNNTFDLLDNPEIKIIGKDTIRVKIVANIDADIDLSEFGIDFEGDTSIHFGTHFDLKVLGDLRGISSDMTSSKESTMYGCQVIDYGLDAIEYEWADDDASDVIAEQVEDYLNLTTYLHNNVFPKVEGSNWGLEVERKWRTLEIPRFLGKVNSNAQKCYKEVENSLIKGKFTSVMKSRKKGSFAITVDSFSTSKNKEIKGEPVAYLETPFITRDIEELIGLELKDERDNVGYIVGGTMEYRQEDAVSLSNFDPSKTSTCPSDVTVQVFFKLIIAYGDIDSGIKTKAEFGHGERYSSEAFVELLQ